MSIIGKAPWLVAKPAAPSQWDDEFEADGLDPKWSRVSGGGLIATNRDQVLTPYQFFAAGGHKESFRTRHGWYSRQPQASYGTGSYGGATEGIQQSIATLPADCFIYIRGTRSNRNSATISDGDGEIFMSAFQAADSRNAVFVAFDTFTNQFGSLFAKTTAAAPTFTNIGQITNYIQRAYPIEFIGFQKRTRTWDGWAATYTGQWVWLGSFTHTVDLDTLIIAFNNSVITGNMNMRTSIDFFRVIPGTKLP